MRDDVLLAYEMNGMPLPPQHGAPLRLVVPGWYGMTNVKWLAEIDLVSEPYRGYQHDVSYRLRRTEDEEGTPVDRMQPRALIAPPGVPDFLTRTRQLEPGTSVLRGRAWSGLAPVTAVEVSVDDGRTWAPAELEDELGRWAWRGWSFSWSATKGEHVLCARARDGDGNEQPLDAEWNVGGYANNGVQRVTVNVA
jgi:DMSO/TMAO reductase YedYZ molybdopterin-dependent catalytic subunit